jgi:Family of unknown function (DUF5662)
MDYDSRPATFLHSQRVGELMVQVIKEALGRSTCHDRSKTEPPEVEVFDEFTPKLKTSTYGSDEYKGYLEAMGEGLKHHYEHNRHHPEFFGEAGVNGMTLVDLIEMLADWKAATERHDDGDLAKSLEIQRERFGLSDQLVVILSGTPPSTSGGCRNPSRPGFLLPIAGICQTKAGPIRPELAVTGRPLVRRDIG